MLFRSAFSIIYPSLDVTLHHSITVDPDRTVFDWGSRLVLSPTVISNATGNARIILSTYPLAQKSILLINIQDLLQKYFCQTRPQSMWANTYVLAFKSFSPNISSFEVTKWLKASNILWHALCNRIFASVLHRYGYTCGFCVGLGMGMGSHI